MVWSWEWMDYQSSEDSSSSFIDSFSNLDTYTHQSSDSDELAEEDQTPVNDTTDTVVFKVIGCTKEKKYQDILSHVKNSQLAVPVKLLPEPNNPFNSKAIAFVCMVGGKWQRIGYVVNEILSEVQSALNNDDITCVEFAWVKYISDWTKSGPGFFAGVKVTKYGIWPYSVKKAASTR